MKTFVLILAMLAAPLGAQNKQPENTAPPQTPAQSASGQPAEQLDEYENKILNRSETFYNNRMNHLLWTMGIIMAAGFAIVGILIPVALELQRKRSFAKEMATRLQEFEKYTKEQTQKLRTELISQIDDREAKQTIKISSNLSMIFSGLGGVFSSQKSEGACNLTLQSNVLSMKFFIIAQCSGACLTANQIIRFSSQPHIASKLTLQTLKAVNGEIEDMKGDLKRIVDAEKRVDMESQVRELQLYVSALIYRKRHGDTTPPQAGRQEDERT